MTALRKHTLAKRFICRITQLCHVGSEDCATQVDLILKCIVACGDKERSYVFTGYRSLIEREDSLTELCGVSAHAYALLLSLLAPLVVRSTDVPIPQELVIFLMTIKLGLPFACISELFGIEMTTARRIFYFILSNLLSAMEKWIPKPPTVVVQAARPPCFWVHYPECQLIIDCTELRTEEPPTIEQQRALFSRYKGRYTFKFLVEILPNGTVTFVSKVYGGKSLGHIYYSRLRFSRPSGARCSAG